MPSEAADKWPKSFRQKAAKKAHDAKRVKHEAIKKRMEHARQHRTKPDLSKGLSKSQPESVNPDAGSTSQIPADTIRAWFEDFMIDLRQMDMYSEACKASSIDEVSNRSADYYRLAMMLAATLEDKAIKLKRMFSRNFELRNGSVRCYDKDWDLWTLSAEEKPRVICQLIRVWGALPITVADNYPDKYLPVWELLVKKEQDWNVVVNWINSAVLERCGRQASKGKCVPRVLGCGLLKALIMQSPVEPVSNKDLSMINGKFNRLGLITLATTSYKKGKQRGNDDDELSD
ncbi:hypothetical protein AtubIFM55763_010057 [Aspergillus tubingensis]|uniref:Uncharacterized protein n=2 Tax=Aspergillus subgen. Circumdati TaxID=2720871 RepID=A0A100ICK1_ASPNG|nr:hypothetical protein AKAW_09772 [Aspergillus niger]GLA77866.1 hypothetical protein AtubIFM55763_010057 [Aspergillus tubingensis]GLA81939.1 hypothetical protein AtubIFM56815_006118 [Aspergillus tubingensis]GLB18177.1 hypothetical protein AtubIFM61612_008068 [Aspergillus tubingensis]